MLRALLVITLAGALGACSADTESATQVSTINDMCPQMGKPVSAEGGTTTFQGATVGFCCAGCGDEFNELDDAGKLAALKDVGVDLNG